jgi:hypothetical protein
MKKKIFNIVDRMKKKTEYNFQCAVVCIELKYQKVGDECIKKADITCKIFKIASCSHEKRIHFLVHIQLKSHF